MKRHVTKYSREQLEQAIERNADPVACYYLQAELNRRGNNGRKAKKDKSNDKKRSNTIKS
jgi:hypothetical protein